VVIHHKKKDRYQANHAIANPKYFQRTSTNYRSQKADQELIGYVKQFIIQSLICLCLLMSLLVLEKIQESTVYESVKSTLLKEIPFSKYNETYQTFLVNLFPFSYRVPAKQSSLTTPVGGVGTLERQGNSGVVEAALEKQLVREIYDHIELRDYADGIIVQTFSEQEINSFISGVVVEIGTDEAKQIGNFITIHRPDDWLVTFGFLNEIMVSRLEHIQVGDSLGLGTTIPSLREDETYYYIAIQNKENEYIDIPDYLSRLINDVGE